jgi:hypothetical protein
MFHLRTYLEFCDCVVVVVDGGDEDFCSFLQSEDSSAIEVVKFPEDPAIPANRINEHGVYCHDGRLRQMALNEAMGFEPDLLVFGDADEVPTANATDWILDKAEEPQSSQRWYADWVNLWCDAKHAIGGNSLWSFENPRGNKKCLAMQPGGDMTYLPRMQHLGLEPGRPGGGMAPAGYGRHWIDSPKLIHMKYAWKGYATRPEAKLERHQPDVMLAGGDIVDVPDNWLPEGIDEVLETMQ